jgi:hypothetical protein
MRACIAFPALDKGILNLPARRVALSLGNEDAPVANRGNFLNRA